MDTERKTPQNRWKVPDLYVPKNGWVHLRVQYQWCEMCEARARDFAHVISHPEHGDNLRVCNDCAKKMTSTNLPDEGKVQEFIEKPWPIQSPGPDGYDQIQHGDQTITIYAWEPKLGLDKKEMRERWWFIFKGKTYRPFRTLKEAKLKVLKLLDEEDCDAATR